MLKYQQKCQPPIQESAQILQRQYFVPQFARWCLMLLLQKIYHNERFMLGHLHTA